MSDPITQPQPQHDDDLDLDWYDDDEDALDPGAEDAAPRRPRRRLVTPASAGLAAVALVAAGFVGGVQVQKHQGGGSGAGGGARAGLPGGFGARAGAGQQGGGAGTGATVGTVANVKGSTLYVTTSDGTTVKVKTNDNSKVTRNASSRPASVHPGDSVVVQGQAASSGTVTASSIAATAKGVSGTAAFPGGGSSVQVPQGFTPPGG
jgi:hypothetical protein